MQNYDMVNFGGGQQTRRLGSRSLDVLDVTESIVSNYYASVYLRQKVDLTKCRSEDLLGREKEWQ